MQLSNKISREAYAGIAVAIAVLFAIATAFAIYSIVDEKPVGAVPTQQTNSTEDTAVLDKCLDALLRAWSITDACYNKKNNSYFFKVAPHPHIDEGWYMLEKFTFIELDNGTWMLKESTQSGEVSPDVTGLRCKSQPADPDWYKDK